MTNLLVCTPMPHPTESLNGYLLRISEENGYETTRHVLRVAGLTKIEGVSSGTLRDAIAPILGLMASDLEHMSYSELLPDGKRNFTILGQSVGPKRSPHPLRLNRSQLCVACVEENGFIDAFWDLGFACACPMHKQEALERCSFCNRRLNPFRPGLLKCKCGKQFTRSCSGAASENLSGLMAILMAKVHGKGIAGVANSNGFPLEELEALSLRALVVMLPLLGQFALGNTLKNDSTQDVANAAADTLANWPANFHLLLRRLDAKRTSVDSPFGMRKRFESFYLSMFKRREESSSFRFLRDEFIRFGLQEWGEGVVDAKLYAKITTTGRFVSQAAIARHLGVQRITARRWAERGLITLKDVRFGNQVRYIADTEEIRPISVNGGCKLEQREAAAFIGLPVSVLRDIRNTEHYPAIHRAAYKQGYDKEDLKLLQRNLLLRSSLLSEDDIPLSECFSLAYVMREIRFWLEDGKSKFVIDYLDGRVKSAGRTGESTEAIWFLRADVSSYAANCRSKASIVSVSHVEAAFRLGCNAAAISTLIDLGHLERRDGRGHVKVCVESLERFSNTYVSTLRLARDLETSARRLNEICIKEELLALSLINSANRHSGFVKKERVPDVVAAIGRHPIRFPRHSKTRAKPATRKID